MRTKFELADVISLFGKGLLAKMTLTPLQLKVLGKISECRTSALGGHEEICDKCGVSRYSYNSCGDRHCPKCQAAKQAFWIDDLVQNTLPVKHFHIIFTVPHHLNTVCLHDQRMYYSILFSTVWNTLYSFGYSRYGCETGAICVLHTWGQNMSLHPHIHCIVPAAGYTIGGEWKEIGHSGKYLYPVHQLSNTFKGKFLDSLKRALRKNDKLVLFNEQVQKAYASPWVVHCEPSMASADHVVKYLGQYTHRVAITNQRLLNIKDEKVTFIAKDYRDRAIKKPVILDGTEFLRRFTMHILPGRFVKIRRYGIYNHTTRRVHDLKFATGRLDINNMVNQKLPPETSLQRFVRLTGIDPCSCPVCKSGRMVVIRELPRVRSPGLLSKINPLLQA